MARYWKESELGKANYDDVAAYRREFVGSDERAKGYKQSALEEKAKNTREKSPYTTSIAMQTRAVMLRRVQILKGAWLAQVLNLA